MKVIVNGDPDELTAFMAWVMHSDSPMVATNLKTGGAPVDVISMVIEIPDEAAHFMRQAGAGLIDAQTLSAKLAQIRQAEYARTNPEDLP